MTILTSSSVARVFPVVFRTHARTNAFTPFLTLPRPSRSGLEKGDRTTHELLLKCVIIITSVVPRSLPMQTAMAVNTALMALMKAGIFCTEPCDRRARLQHRPSHTPPPPRLPHNATSHQSAHPAVPLLYGQYFMAAIRSPLVVVTDRVPFAGKIDSILFDKTGTLTTDRLVPVGIVNGDVPSEKKARRLPRHLPHGIPLPTTLASPTLPPISRCSQPFWHAHVGRPLPHVCANPSTGERRQHLRRGRAGGMPLADCDCQRWRVARRPDRDRRSVGRGVAL